MHSTLYTLLYFTPLHSHPHPHSTLLYSTLLKILHISLFKITGYWEGCTRTADELSLLLTDEGRVDRDELLRGAHVKLLRGAHVKLLRGAHVKLLRSTFAYT
jgi:hypothetical protein